MIECPYCHSTTRQNKAGKTKAGVQRYRCKHCNRSYLPNRKRRNDPTVVQELAAEARLDGTGPQPAADDLQTVPQTETPDLAVDAPPASDGPETAAVDLEVSPQIETPELAIEARLDGDDAQSVVPDLPADDQIETRELDIGTELNGGDPQPAVSDVQTAPQTETRLDDNNPQLAALDPQAVPQKETPALTNQPVVYPIVRIRSTSEEATLQSNPSSTSIALPVAQPLVVPFPVEKEPRFLARVVGAKTISNAWGWLPEIVLLESLGLLILAWAFVKAQAVTESAQLFFWIGLAVMILPVAFRLASAEPSRRERLALVILLSMSLYLVKVMHSPIAFTFPDELSHMRNVTEILETHRLFQENPVQPVTAFYPGLPTLTSTLSSLSGLSAFSAGNLVIGTGRLILFLALYLLFEQVSGSARTASLATVFYMANPNFLYWTAEYAYEPLALPLLAFVLLMVAKREMANDRSRSGAWMAAAVFGVLTVVITHHMSSYILAALLVGITVLFIIHSRGKQWGPWQLALLAVFATSIWLIFIANITINYLSPVLSGASRAVVNMIAHEETSRQLFTSSKEATESRIPIWEQLVTITSVIVIVLGLPFGAFEIWKRHRNKVFALLLGAIAIAYLPVQMLRFTQAGWETANRSSEFLFIGIGFVLALGVVNFWLPNWAGWKSNTVLAGLSLTLFFGGLIAGWAPRARLARPYVIDTGNYLVRPQVVSVSEWMLEYLGPDNRIAASKADAKLMGAYGQYPFTDNGPIKKLFLSEEFGPSERTTLLKRDIRYIMSDRKNVSWDQMIGYYFYNSYSTRTSDLRLIEPWIFEKFERVHGVTRLLDSGDIVIYDVGRYLEAFKKPGDTATLEPTIIPTPDTLPATDRDEDSGTSALITPIPEPGCMWYTVQDSDTPMNLTTLSSLAIDGSGQMHCLDWSAP